MRTEIAHHPLPAMTMPSPASSALRFSSTVFLAVWCILMLGCHEKPGVRISDPEDRRLNPAGPDSSRFEVLGESRPSKPLANMPAPGAPGGPPSVESLNIAPTESAGPATELVAGIEAVPIGGVVASRIDLNSIPTFAGALFEERNQDSAELERGAALFKQNKIDEALVHFQRAAAANPNNAIAYEDIGLCYAAKNDVSRAMANFDTAVRLDLKNPTTRVYRGTLLIRQRLYTQAIEDFTVALKTDPKNLTARLWRGVASLNLRLFDDVVADADAAIAAAPSIPDGHYIRCLAHLQSGQIEKGRVDFQLAVKNGLDPQARKMIQDFLDSNPSP